MKIIDLLTRIETTPYLPVTSDHDARALIRMGLATKSNQRHVFWHEEGMRCLKLTADGRDLLHGASERRMSA